MGAPLDADSCKFPILGIPTPDSGAKAAADGTPVIDVALSFLPAIAGGFVTYSAIDALYQAFVADDTWMMAFVVSAYGILALLFLSLRKFEKIPERSSPEKTRWKFVIWTLAMLLNAVFSYRVCVILQSTAISWVIGTIACFTAVAGFFALFFGQDPAVPAEPLSPRTAMVASKV